ncbi:hypothetical protein AX16_004371 [Volvariella volvacea WC 439]|nr:hypothetical protein AX16_004371 [Volvariella volvacea WC 439]
MTECTTPPPSTGLEHWHDTMTVTASQPQSSIEFPSFESHGLLRDPDGRQWIKHPSQIDSPYTYTPVQIFAYLKEIKFPVPLSSAGEINLNSDEYAVRVVGELSLIPFSRKSSVRRANAGRNTIGRCYYSSASHDVDVTPEGVFKRLVEEKKGGSWCFGLNGLLFGVLRSLGYRVYTGLARVNDTPGFVQPYDFTSFSHMILFVQPFADYDKQGNEVGSDGGSRITYLVDVGLASRRLMQPILLHESEEGVTGISKSERHRLRRSVGVGKSSTCKYIRIPAAQAYETNIDQLLLKTATRKDGSDKPPLSSWFLQVRNIGQFNDEWRTTYTFTETEFLPQDHAHSNIGVCYTPRGLLWDNVLVVRHVPGETESGMDRIVLFGGRLSAFGETRTLSTEEERIRVLKEIFEIDVGDVRGAIRNIKGRVSALLQGE